MAKIDDSDFTPKPPKIPSVGEKIGDLDEWVSSEDPHEGRYTGMVVDGEMQKSDENDDCDEEHASR